MIWEFGDNINVSPVVQALGAPGGGVPVSPGTNTTSIGTSTTGGHHQSTSTISVPTSTGTGTKTPTSTGHHHHTSTTSSAADTPTSTLNESFNPVIPPNSGNCDSPQPWNSGTTYTGGTLYGSTATCVTYNGSLWKNRWWTLGDAPTGDDGNPWAKVGPAPSKRSVETSEDELKSNVSRAKRRSHKMRRVYVPHFNSELS